MTHAFQKPTSRTITTSESSEGLILKQSPVNFLTTMMTTTMTMMTTMTMTTTMMTTMMTTTMSAGPSSADFLAAA